MSLYDLNKDELIKLITTIQDITRKDCEKQYKDKIKEILLTEELYMVSQCDHDECDDFYIKGELGNEIYSTSEITKCCTCPNNYCDKHIQENITYIDDEPCCNECLSK